MRPGAVRSSVVRASVRPLTIPPMSPFLLHVVWHPDLTDGAAIAERLRVHFGGNRFQNLLGGAGVPVLFRNENGVAQGVPIPVRWDDADVVATVVLVDHSLVGDARWVQYLQELANQAEAKGLSKRVFPVAMESGVFGIGLQLQAFRWYTWDGDNAERQQRLHRDLTYEFSRMMRHQIEQELRNGSPNPIRGYLQKVQVFLSHSKRDGAPVASAIRDWIHQNTALDSFMDVYDIPPGVSFEAVIDESIETSVLVAIHTDSYSSREWCRREVIAAKRRHLPMVIVDCLQSIDERAFPYLGNVPVIRINPCKLDRIDRVIGVLLDEVFKDYLWRCRTAGLSAEDPGVLFLPRPPEILALATLPAPREDGTQDIVYPDPPLGVEEADMFAAITGSVRLRALSEWLRRD